MSYMKMKCFIVVQFAIVIIFTSVTLFGQSAPSNNPSGCDTIPMTLTSYNNMSVEAIVNNVDTVDLMFHTASGAVFITKEGSKHMKGITWDDSSAINSWGGRSDVRYSSSNHLSIGGLQWDSIAITEDTHSGHFTDGKFGPDMFGDKIIEIDVEQHVIILHDELPEMAKHFSRLDVAYKIGAMFLTGEIIINQRVIEHSFMVHSGYSGTILLDDAFMKEHDLYKAFEIIGEKILTDSGGNELVTKKAMLPAFNIGGHVLKNVPIAFFEGALANQNFSITGGDLLKRFHLLIDRRNDHVYLRPNGLAGEDYTKL